MHTALQALTVVMAVSVLSCVFAGDEKAQPPDAASGVRNWSEAVRAGDADFQLNAPATLAQPENGAANNFFFCIKVANVSNAPLQIDVFDTLSFTLTDAAGKVLSCKHARDATFAPPPVLIAKGGTTLISRNAKLETGTAAGSFKISGADGAGGWWWFDDVMPGKYTVSVTISNSKKTWEHLQQTPAKSRILDATTAPLWIASATTKAIDMSVAAKP